MKEMTRRVTVPGGALEVRLKGGTGPVLVCVHYWGGSAGTWSEVIGHLPPEQATVRFDQRGWGTARALPGPYHLDRLADDLARVVEECVPGPYVLVGHSMGGKVAQLLAARRPLGLAGLFLLAPAPAEPPATVTEEYRRDLSHAYDSPEAVRHALNDILTATPLPGATLATAVRDSLAAGPQARQEWPLRGMARDISRAVRDITVPVTVLAGERDVVESARVLRACLLPRIPHAALLTVPGAGHLLPLEAPHAVAVALAAFVEQLHGRDAGLGSGRVTLPS